MATISSPGIGSGLDVNSIITSLMAIESKPLDQLKTSATKIQTQISEVGKITSALSKFRDLATKLSAVDFWKQTTGTASNSAIGVTTSSSATASDYSVAVSSLASAQAIASPAFASSTALVGDGTLHIETGTWGANKASFTASGTVAALDITVAADDTLASLRDKVNAAGGAVTASILTDSSGARLVLRSRDTGADNAFRTSVTGTGLGGLAYDPSTGSNGATLSQSAANAAATIDGLPVSSATNALNDVLDGVSLTLNAVTTAPVTVSVKPDTAAMKKTLQDFATAYSDLAKLITTDTKYDATAKTGGPLQGDSAIVGLQSRLRAVLGGKSAASSAFATLSDAGFEQQRDGSLTVNSTKLDKALANLPELKKLFSGASTTDASLDGFGKRLRLVAGDALGIDGQLTSRSDGLNEKMKHNKDAQDAMQSRLAQTQARLEKQYSALDAKLGSLNSLSAYVTQQIAQWNKA